VRYAQEIVAVTQFDGVKWGYDIGFVEGTVPFPSTVDGAAGAGQFYVLSALPCLWLKPGFDNTTGNLLVTPRIHVLDPSASFRRNGLPHVLTARKFFKGCIHGVSELAGESLYIRHLPSAPALTALSGGQLSGDYIYAVGFVIGGQKTIGGTVAAISLNANSKVLVKLDRFDSRGRRPCTARIIYRTKQGGSQLYELATIANNDPNQEFEDNIADSALTVLMPDPGLLEDTRTAGADDYWRSNPLRPWKGIDVPADEKVPDADGNFLYQFKEYMVKYLVGDEEGTIQFVSREFARSMPSAAFQFASYRDEHGRIVDATNVFSGRGVFYSVESVEATAPAPWVDTTKKGLGGVAIVGRKDGRVIIRIAGVGGVVEKFEVPPSA
jgi:hypothetical protein